MAIKKAIIYAVAILTLLSAFVNLSFNVSVAENTNTVIKNASFEDAYYDDFSWGYNVDYWDFSDVWSISVVEGDSYDQDKHVNFSSKGTHTITSSDLIGVKSATAYSFGVKFRSNNLSTTCKISVVEYSNSLELESYEGQVFNTTVLGEWSDASYTHVVSENANNVKLTVTVGAVDGSACIDYAYGYQAHVFTNKGCSLRLDENLSGLRFSGKINKDFYDDCLENYTEVTLGMLIIPEEYLSEIGEFTFKALEGKTVLDIKVEKWNNAKTVDSDGFYGYNCAIVDIKEGNIKKTFCARSYLSYKDGDTTKYFYSEYNEDLHSRSIFEVANLAMEEIDLYDVYEQKIITAYANGNKPNFEN